MIRGGNFILILTGDLAEKINLYKKRSISQDMPSDELDSITKIENGFSKEDYLQLNMEGHQIMDILQFQKILNETLKKLGLKMI